MHTHKHTHTHTQTRTPAHFNPSPPSVRPLHLLSFSGVIISLETDLTSADLTNAKNVDKVNFEGRDQRTYQFVSIGGQDQSSSSTDTQPPASFIKTIIIPYFDVGHDEADIIGSVSLQV